MSYSPEQRIGVEKRTEIEERAPEEQNTAHVDYRTTDRNA